MDLGWGKQACPHPIYLRGPKTTSLEQKSLSIKRWKPQQQRLLSLAKVLTAAVFKHKQEQRKGEGNNNDEGKAVQERQHWPVVPEVWREGWGIGS